ncbi:hypothetical protein PH210_24385 [Paenibacillus sp. BSR1-1]|uniref:hypothetical protein n=1 Tax=Paenibacillus sp. BSR1-1 TaxID=3020845 RepID=UPI0025B13DD9|nr:hypothetical protein [Paenibacillus sp. BSR1-1]MDN3019313.1 hypothetical protein [Paenibacillus sp. BSR1-1]
MSLKDLFHKFGKNDYEKELKRKLLFLEMNLEELKKSLQTIQEQIPAEAKGKSQEAPIIIEKINIEKIILDKYELNNNFGQLGIKELKGKLNIGATYGSEFTPALTDEERGEEQGEIKKTSTEKSPRVNIQAKKEV